MYNNGIWVRFHLISVSITILGWTKTRLQVTHSSFKLFPVHSTHSQNHHQILLSKSNAVNCLSNLAEFNHEPNQNRSFHRTIYKSNNLPTPINQNWTWELKNPSKQKSTNSLQCLTHCLGLCPHLLDFHGAEWRPLASDWCPQSWELDFLLGFHSRWSH